MFRLCGKEGRFCSSSVLWAADFAGLIAVCNCFFAAGAGCKVAFFDFLYMAAISPVEFHGIGVEHIISSCLDIVSISPIGS